MKENSIITLLGLLWGHLHVQFLSRNFFVYLHRDALANARISWYYGKNAIKNRRAKTDMLMNLKYTPTHPPPTHTHTHTLIDTPTHPHTHTHTHWQTHSHAHKHMHTNTYTHTLSLSHTPRIYCNITKVIRCS